jgi:hypothetical protein
MVVLITDTHVTNCFADCGKSESRVKSGMSATGTVLKMAVGHWVSEPNMTKQVLAIGRQVKPIEPRYDSSVDLLPVVAGIADANYDGKKGLQRQVVDCFILWRMMTARRTDCATKWDVRDVKYTRLYDEHGAPVVRVGDAPRMDMRILDPKDPSKNGRWPKWISIFRIRHHLLFDKNIPHLDDYAKLDRLDLFWQLQGLLDRLEDKYNRAPKTGFFISAMVEDAGVPRRLGSQRLQNLLRDRLDVHGIKMQKNEAEGGDENGKVRGRYVRGHVGSVVHELATKYQMGFAPMDMVIQAGHSDSMFVRSYSRPIVPRQEQAVVVHTRRGELSIGEVQLK